jgi:hypothetical protein
MTTFQFISLLVFGGAVVAAYGKDIFAWVRARVPALPSVPEVPEPSDNVQSVVGDLVTVAALRDKFAATGCQDGVDACSILLKIIIDHRHPHAE